MAEKPEIVSLQIYVPKRTRTRLKSEAAAQELDMADLGEIALDYVLDLFDSGKLPSDLAKAVSARKDAKKKAD